MKKQGIDYVSACAAIGEAVVELVRESGLLKKKAGRRKKYRRRKKAADADGAEKPKRVRKKKETKSERNARLLKEAEEAATATQA